MDHAQKQLSANCSQIAFGLLTGAAEQPYW